MRAPDEKRARWVNSKQYDPFIDARLNSMRPTAGIYGFTASDNEFYTVLSLVNPPEAFMLLLAGARSESDVWRELGDRDALDLMVPRSEMMQELLRRGISPEHTAAGLMWTAFHRYYREIRMDINVHDPILHADAIELFTLIQNEESAMFHEPPYIAVRQDVLTGHVALETVKALLPEVRKLSQIASMSAATTDLNKPVRSYEFTLDDLKRFAGRASVFFEVTLHRLTVVFANCGIEAMDQVRNLHHLYDFIEMIDAERAGLLLTPEQESEDCRLAMQGAMYHQALTVQRPLVDGEYFNVLADAELLHQANVALDDAMPYLVDGIPASKISGLLSGMQQGVAEGWL